MYSALRSLPTLRGKRSFSALFVAFESESFALPNGWPPRAALNSNPARLDLDTPVLPPLMGGSESREDETQRVAERRGRENERHEPARDPEGSTSNLAVAAAGAGGALALAGMLYLLARDDNDASSARATRAQSDASSDSSSSSSPPRSPTIDSNPRPRVSPPLAYTGQERPKALSPSLTLDSPSSIRAVDDRVRRQAWERISGAPATWAAEFATHREVLRATLERDEDYPFVKRGLVYLQKHEYELVPGRSDLGKGDFIFANIRGDSLAVIECKTLREDTGKSARTKRNKDRNQVSDQARRYQQVMQNYCPHLNVECYIVFKERGQLSCQRLA